MENQINNQNINNQEQKSFQKKKTKISNGVILLALFAIIFTIMASCVVGYLLYKKLNSPSLVVQPRQLVTPGVNKKAAIEPSPELTETPQKEPTPIKKPMNQILWNSPKEIASLKLFDKGKQTKPREKTAKYYKVGKFIDGKYKGGEIILVSAEEIGLSSFPEFYRFVKLGDNLIFLKKYSDELYSEDQLIRSRFIVDEKFTIQSLDFPEYLNGPNKRQVLKLNKGISTNVLFDSHNIKKIFTDKEFGNVYTTKNYPSTFSDVFARHGFYIKAPDGTAKIYSLKLDFIGEYNIPKIKWNDGTQNNKSYSFSDVSGCGSSNYASVISKEVISPANDLEITGKNSMGDAIYEIKDKNHYLLRDYYDNKYKVFVGQKVPYNDFLKNHPLFFWIDPFGRLIKFQSNEFVPAAECAKPAIYLYPNETTKISVKIEPKGGLTYSEPKYKNGWFVQADADGNITELSSGKNFNYLFWEGRGEIYEQPKVGFVVERKNVHNFLIEKLTKLGLNQRETNDFIEFWEPKMKSSPYYFVTFLGNMEMNQIAPLRIEPKPDTVIRILMDFSPLKNPIDVKEYEIITPKRNGFTVVEWGGVLNR